MSDTPSKPAMRAAGALQAEFDVLIKADCGVDMPQNAASQMDIARVIYAACRPRPGDWHEDFKLKPGLDAGEVERLMAAAILARDGCGDVLNLAKNMQWLKSLGGDNTWVGMFMASVGDALRGYNAVTEILRDAEPLKNPIAEDTPHG